MDEAIHEEAYKAHWDEPTRQAKSRQRATKKASQKTKPVRKRVEKTSSRTTNGKRQLKISKLSRDSVKSSHKPALHNNLFHDHAQQGDARQEPVLAAEPLDKSKVFQNLRQQKPQDKDLAKVYLQDCKCLENAYSTFGPRKVKASALGWSVKGMESILKSHQLLGSAFMVQRENGTETPRGGILADVMGMGKTVQTLATIAGTFVGHKRRRQSRQGPTLVIVPSGLVDQWYRECQTHLENNTVRYRVYRRKDFQAAAGQSLEEFDKYDLWLTSYWEVQASFQSYLATQDMIDSLGHKSRELKELEMTSSLLHTVNFHRVVLDEGHVIRNPKTSTFESCFMLKAHARWVLSGTPLMNHPKDLWALFTFLRLTDLPTRRNFGTEFLMNNGGQILASTMLRRTHADRLLGAKLIVLPKARHLRSEFTMGRLEQQIYDIVCTRMDIL